MQTRSKLKNFCAFYAFPSNIDAFPSNIEPKNVNEVLVDSDWVGAMQDELHRIERNKVWHLVPRPENRTIIGTKWVFRNKLDELGIITRNKAGWWFKAITKKRALIMKKPLHLLQGLRLFES